MGITKKEAKEQFANNQNSKSDRAVELLPLHIFFHICSTKIPYKSAGKESIASEGEMKKYMKFCLSDLYRRVSAQIRRDLKIKDDENRLKLYKYYIPLIVDAVSDSIKVDRNRLSELFIDIAEKHVKKEIIPTAISIKDNGETNVRKKQIMSAGEKNNKTVNKNTMVKEKDIPKNLSQKVLRNKKIEKLTLDDFNRR
jgi:DNA topoisomerase VI subunit B